MQSQKPLPISFSTATMTPELHSTPPRDDALRIAHAALDAVADGVVVVDPAGWRICQLNAPARVLLDIDRAGVQDFERIRLRLRREDRSVPPAAALLPAAHDGAIYRYLRTDGRSVPVEIRSSIVRLDQGDRLVLVFRDLSERVQAAAELRHASSRCGITFSQAATGLAHVTLDCSWGKVNPRLLAITGYAEEELLGRSISELTHPDDIVNETRAYRQLLLGDLPYYTREKRYVRKDGSVVWVGVTSSLARDDAGRALYFIAMVEDISERKRAEDRVRHLAGHDLMTGLPNRHRLLEHLQETLLAARHGRYQAGVLFVDMDKLKLINDSRGHEQGDQALVRFTRLLQQQVRSGDMVARIGGDEFVIVLGRVLSRAEVTAILDRTLRALARAAGSDTATAPSCSIGVSLFPDDGEDCRTLIRHADLAMYRAKQEGGARYVFFSDPHAAPARSHPQHATSTGTP